MPPTPDTRGPDRLVVAQRWFDGRKLIESPVRVLISGDRIAHVGGPQLEHESIETIFLDAEAILCPGFIDTHSHSDFSIPDDPRAVGAIIQGITTQVVGQCGFSAAPLSSRDDEVTDPLSVADDPTALPTAKPPGWQSFGEFRELLGAMAPAIDIVPFVGHNTAIRASNSTDPDRVADTAEQAILEGARGVSTGLSYQPGRQTTDTDVARIVSLAGRHAVPYHTHMRYSTDETIHTLNGTLDLLAGRCGIATISHVFPRLRDRESTVDGLVSAIERRAPEFDSLTFDVTVYESGGTPWTHGLPKWAIGGDLARLEDCASNPAWRQRVMDHLSNRADGWVVDWKGLLISKVNHVENREVLGQTVGDLAERAGVAPEQYAVDLLRDDGHFWVSPPNKRWRDVLQLLGSDRCIPMGDGITVDPARAGCLVALERSWNAFRRFLVRVVPEARMSVETALRKLTSDGANRLGLPDRGLIAGGAYADLTVLNLSRLRELIPPGYEPTDGGIEGVMVNGEWVLDPRQIWTAARPGRVI